MSNPNHLRFLEAAAAAGLTKAQTDEIYDYLCPKGGSVNARLLPSAIAAIERIGRGGVVAVSPNAATTAQVRYLLDLGADPAEVDGLTRVGASALIDALKAKAIADARARYAL